MQTHDEGIVFSDPAVAAAFDAFPAPARARLLELRALILGTAAATQGVGRIEETLKWGQPSYLTPETGSGSTVRIDAARGEPDRFAAYFHCQTDLIATFRRLYPDRFEFEGNRALTFRAGEPLPVEELRHCIALALTHHARKKRGAREEPARAVD